MKSTLADNTPKKTWKNPQMFLISSSGDAIRGGAQPGINENTATTVGKFTTTPGVYTYGLHTQGMPNPFSNVGKAHAKHFYSS